MATARLDIRLDEQIKAKAPNPALTQAFDFAKSRGF